MRTQKPTTTASAPETRTWQVVEDDKSKDYFVVEYANKMRQQMKRTIPAENPIANSCPECGAFPVKLRSPTLHDHIRDLHDAATRFEDRAKRAEAHANALAEALRELLVLCDEFYLVRGERIPAARETLAAYEAAR